MTATDTELELFEALDFDAQLACEAVPDCANPSRWFAVNFTCCGYTFPACEPCRVRLLEWLKGRSYVICLKCHTFVGTDPVPIRYDPIRGVS